MDSVSAKVTSSLGVEEAANARILIISHTVGSAPRQGAEALAWWLARQHRRRAESGLTNGRKAAAQEC